MYTKWISLFILLSITCTSGDSTVRTLTGKVRGTTVQLPDGASVEAFLGIPFAEPPVGKLRFEKPIPIAPWEGEYNATFWPPPCYQNYTDFNWSVEVERMTEDCLYLNIWVPGSLQDTKPKAVFVWIHGGAFTLGSSATEDYNGAMLASRGNILVASMNYRLGIFGFLTTSLPEVSGNMGIYDQIMAVKWIKANIAAFGGSPDEITLAGQSAGAICSVIFLVSPLTRGLVKRVILESSGLVHSMWTTATQDMKKVANEIARATGCSKGNTNLTSNPKMVVDCLKQLPPNAITEAEGSIKMMNPLTAEPHNDGVLFPLDPVEMLTSGMFQETEVLLGANKDEGSVFLAFVLPDYFGLLGEDPPVLKKRFTYYMIKTIFGVLNQQNADAVANFYVEGRGNRKVGNQTDDNVDYMKIALYDSLGDFLTFCPTVFQADCMSTKSKPVYFYVYTHRPSVSFFADWMGVTHYTEVWSVFGRPLTSHQNYSEDDKIVSRRVMDRWSAFVRTGNPNIPDEVEWLPYKWNEPVYLDIGVREKMGNKPDSYRCEFWRDRLRANISHFRADSFVSHGIASLQVKASYALLTFCLLFLTTPGE